MNNTKGQIVPITTEVVSSNPVHGEVYSIQHYVIRFAMSCDRSVVFSGYPAFSTNILVIDRHDITEILLKVALNQKLFTHKLASGNQKNS